MLDVFNTPTSTGICDVQTFTGSEPVTNLGWKTWIKPRGKAMCQIICISGGGGAGGGFTRAVNLAGGGGGSGSSSGITKIIVPLILLPDILYVQAGAGGIGNLSGAGVAGSGILSYVSVYPDIDSNNVICISGAAGPTGGSAASGTAGGLAAAAAGTIATISNMQYGTLGIAHFRAGRIGLVGTAGGSGDPASVPLNDSNSLVPTPGCSGAGIAVAPAASSNGGAFTAIASSLISFYAPTVPLGPGNNGTGGLTLWKPFFSYGGCGGASSNTTPGGAGGDGGIGSGGGGGGSGTTGGKGGDGGPGLVIIISW